MPSLGEHKKAGVADAVEVEYAAGRVTVGEQLPVVIAINYPTNLRLTARLQVRAILVVWVAARPSKITVHKHQHCMTNLEGATSGDGGIPVMLQVRIGHGQLPIRAADLLMVGL